MSESTDPKADKAEKIKATDTAPGAAEASTEASQSENPAAEAKKSAPKAKKATAKKAAEPVAEEKAAEAVPVSAESAPAEKKVETAADVLSSDVGELKVRRAKGSKNVVSGICHVLATFNNTMVTFTDKAGNVIARSSSGKCGFRSAKKSTAYAAQVVCQDAAKVAMSHGLKDVEVHLKGPGMGRDSAVRTLQTLGLGVSSIVDVTPIPHNGCRPRKRRRV
jgi:small subunit ribosomal protein S11